MNADNKQNQVNIETEEESKQEETQEAGQEKKLEQEEPQASKQEQQATEKESSDIEERAEEKSKEEKLQAEIDQLNDKFLRLYSEFDNYRKRTNRERQELRKTAGEDIIVSLLPVLDDFDRAIQSIQESEDAGELYKGIELIYTKLKSVLEQKGLEEMDSIGKDFDTDYHEAVTYVPAPKEELKDKIVDITQKGYMLNGKVIRFAKVVLGN
ncbi:MAG: nucleotide exchange factor GrpE [Bacteroidales bacterium]|nr:nucleotide exchange factor GrpE [Bacteroidales bacterium]